MSRPPLDQKIVEFLKNAFMADIDQSAEDVYRKLRRSDLKGRNGLEASSSRTVRALVSEWRRSIIDEVPRSIWKLWEGDGESPEDHDYLIRSNMISRLFFDRPLYKSEAEWGRRLKVSLMDLNPFLQLIFVREYSSRYYSAERLSTEPYTSDLDDLLAYQPWKSDEHADAMFGAYHQGKTNINILVESATKGRAPLYEIDGKTYLRKMVFSGRDRWNINMHTIFFDLHNEYGPAEQLEFWTWGEGASWEAPEMS